MTLTGCSDKTIEHRSDVDVIPDASADGPRNVPRKEASVDVPAPDVGAPRIHPPPDAHVPDARVPDARVPDARVPDARPPEQPATCVLSRTSTIPGVHIEFPAQPCAFTLAQAARGVVFHYDVVVDQDVSGYVSRPNGTGVIEYPGASLDGLRIATVIQGGVQRYCLCDQGGPPPFCDLPDGGYSYRFGSNGESTCDPITISKGIWHLAWPSYAEEPSTPFPWDGRNWDGPSDTANAEGAPFPPGDYALTVTIAGQLVSDAGTTDVGAEARFLVRIVP